VAYACTQRKPCDPVDVGTGIVLTTSPADVYSTIDSGCVMRLAKVPPGVPPRSTSTLAGMKAACHREPVAVADDVGVAVVLDDGVPLGVMVDVGVSGGVPGTEPVPLAVCDGLGVTEAVTDELAVLVAEGVGSAVSVADAERVDVGERDGVRVDDGEAVTEPVVDADADADIVLDADTPGDSVAARGNGGGGGVVMGSPKRYRSESRAATALGRVFPPAARSRLNYAHDAVAVMLVVADGVCDGDPVDVGVWLAVRVLDGVTGVRSARTGTKLDEMKNVCKRRWCVGKGVNVGVVCELT
jgi:hypothetical protein